MRYRLLILLMLLAWLPEARAIQLPGLDAFIDEMVQRHQFDRATLESAFAQAKHRQSIINAFSGPATRKPWPEYRANFVEPRRIRRGVAFWLQHQETLARAEQQYGVPAEIVVALIGIETFYGRDTGKIPTLDALTTLAFDYPRRADFFRGELEQFLLLVREQGLGFLEVKGSFAGALGVPQFMPSSYRHYAVDFDQDGKVDLMSNMQDVIGSVANYLHHFGWRRGEKVAIRSSNFTGEGSKVQRSLAEWAKLGVVASDELSINMSQRATLVEFSLAEGQETWLAFDNFSVITQYNNSTYYAMSVLQLSEQLRAAFMPRSSTD